MTGIESDLSALTVAELRALAEACRARAQTDIVTTLEPIIQLAIVVMELAKRGDASAIAQQAALPAWQAGDVAWAAVSPLTLYYQPGPGHSQALAVTWAMDVLEVKGEWLRVTKDGRWAWYADCKKEP